jgi:hypothetical protein
MAGMGVWPERKVRWAVLAGAVAVVTGCATTGSGMCTAVGCSSGLTVAGPYVVQNQHVKWMRVCVAGSCRTAGVPPSSGVGFLGEGLAPTAALQVHTPVKVSITLETANHTKLVSAGGSVRLRKNAPNGVACGPVCYQANVTVHSNGTLTMNLG